MFPAGKANFKDRYDTKIVDWIKPWDGKEGVKIGLIGLPLSKSSISHSGAFLAPKMIRELFANYSTYVEDERINLNDLEVKDIGDVQMHPTDIIGSHQRIEDSLSLLYEHQPKMQPIIIGGDHSVTAPSVKAFKKKIGGEIGIIQFDAHHDIRNLEDGGPTNGTPFRTLIESGTINPKNLVQIGIRNYANAEHYREEAEGLGITVYPMKEVRTRPIKEIIEEAIKIASNGTEAIYVSLDIDVLDQAFAPGAVAIGPGGMDTFTLFDAVELLAQEKKVKGFDLVCIDPMQDFRNMTSRVGVQLILQFLRGKYRFKNGNNTNKL
ncbi:formimidoylglutamase [Vulcanibacillus modesticaldus]|uniref:Formimidoylglutamase n=1 Tax=Vulcanibacillus modesticaldus TaxID=337097 RepID=A0A1D2YTU0_9BACI|nr:formimidoylglutamase [Vulcanibacillus modesticaldus]